MKRFVLTIFAVLLFALAAGATPCGAVQPAHSLAPADGTEFDQTPVFWKDGTGRSTLTYFSDGLKVKAYVYRSKADGPLPLVIFNHGGVSGVPEKTDERCRELAGLGYVVIAPFFRGEDGSEGEVEVALGEVTDVLAALSWAERTLKDEIVQGRTAMAGTSHGALISMLAAARDNRIKAVVSAYGVMNIDLWYRYLVAADMLGEDELTKRAYGGGPEINPELFKPRNVWLQAEKIDCPVLIIQGAQDTIVPPSQAWVIYKRLKGLNRDVTYDGPYPNSGHGMLFRWDEEKYGPEQIEECAEAWESLVVFLDKHLKVKSDDGAH